MLVANPIYDSVFKYLMDDAKVARVFLGALTGFDIESVELRPTEVHLPKGKGRDFTVYRLDFAARVKTSEGIRVILIEIQKAKFPTDIMRFRRYLGSQYASDQNCHAEKDPHSDKPRKVADPIFSIYLLGHRLAHTTAPVIRVLRTCCDAATGKPISRAEEFIECLTHDSVIVQIPELRNHRRNRLEKLLAIFDQEQVCPENHQGMEIDEASIPKEFQFVLRKLVQAYAQKKVRQMMTVEDEILADLENRDRAYAAMAERAAEEQRQKEEALRDKITAQQKYDQLVEALRLSGKSDAEIRTLTATAKRQPGKSKK